MGVKESAVTLSSCTSEPVATASAPTWPAAWFTLSNPTDCSKGRGPAATCERTNKVNGRENGGFSVTRSLRVFGSKRQTETKELDVPGALAFLASAGATTGAGSSTSVMVAPPGTSKVSSATS